MATTTGIVGHIFTSELKGHRVFFICFGDLKVKLEGMRVVFNKKHEVVEAHRCNMKRDFLRSYTEVTTPEIKNMITRKVLEYKRKLHAEAEAVQSNLQQVFLATSWIR